MRTYIIYCDACGYKKVVEDPSNVGLREYPTSSVQGRIPAFNKEKNKTETFDHIKTMPKYKCPQCGRVVTLKKFNVPKKEYTPDEDKTETNESDQIQ